MLEKIVVRSYFNLIFRDPKANSTLSDRYAFQPSGSTTTSALITLTHRMKSMHVER